MQPQSQQKIEELLEKVGSHEVPGDPEHRYALRRKLLCSSYFGEEECEKNARRDKVVTFTIPLFAGSLLIIVFATFGNSLTQGPTQKQLHFNQVATAVPTFEVVEQPSQDHLAQFVQYDNVVPLEEVVRFVPAERVIHARVR